MRKFLRASPLERLSAALLVIALVASFVLVPAPVLAHGEASISVSPTTVAPGGTITVNGDGLEVGENFTIELQGIAFGRTLGTVAGEDETFERSFEIPANAPPGTYRVQATSEGGEAMTAELTIQGDAEPGERTPSEELMDLDRTRSSTELAVIGVLLLASFVVGVVLIRQE